LLLLFNYFDKMVKKIQYTIYLDQEVNNKLFSIFSDVTSSTLVELIGDRLGQLEQGYKELLEKEEEELYEKLKQVKVKLFELDHHEKLNGAKIKADKELKLRKKLSDKFYKGLKDVLEVDKVAYIEGQIALCTDLVLKKSMLEVKKRFEGDKK